MSGVRVFESGVGTQIVERVELRQRGVVGRRAEPPVDGVVALGGDVDEVGAPLVDGPDALSSRSMPVTSKPASANSIASGRPA